jgi:hypothetical protein
LCCELHMRGAAAPLRGVAAGNARRADRANKTILQENVC